jgi:hypothetical protein
VPQLVCHGAVLGHHLAQAQPGPGDIPVHDAPPLIRGTRELRHQKPAFALHDCVVQQDTECRLTAVATRTPQSIRLPSAAARMIIQICGLRGSGAMFRSALRQISHVGVMPSVPMGDLDSHHPQSGTARPRRSRWPPTRVSHSDHDRGKPSSQGARSAPVQHHLRRRLASGSQILDGPVLSVR